MMSFFVFVFGTGSFCFFKMMPVRFPDHDIAAFKYQIFFQDLLSNERLCDVRFPCASADRPAVIVTVDGVQTSSSDIII